MTTTPIASTRDQHAAAWTNIRLDQLDRALGSIRRNYRGGSWTSEETITLFGLALDHVADQLVDLERFAAGAR